MYIQEIHKVEASVTHKIREFDICLGVIVENFFLQRETNSKENAQKKKNWIFSWVWKLLQIPKWQSLSNTY